MKRAADIIVAATGLIVLSPLLAALWLLVAVRLGRPVFFRQMRPGLGGRAFQMIKFRTMTDARGADGLLLPDADRLTRFGRLLRATSLDELPELYNVLRGDMSLVGPRPLLMEYLPLYSAAQGRRHDVRPGMTGWAQINGRNSLDWADKLALDTWYVDHRSIVLDLRILLKTIVYVASQRGTVAAAIVAVPKCDGNADCQRDIVVKR